MAVLRWGLFIVGLILFALIYSGFLQYAAYRTAAISKVDGWVGLFVALPPAQIAFISGFGVAAKLANRPRLALTWCVVLLGFFVVLDFLIYLYYGIGSCLVVC